MKMKDQEKCDNKACASKKKRKLLQGIILIIIGAIFLLNNYGFTDFDIGKLWPLFLIVPGVFMVFRSEKDH